MSLKQILNIKETSNAFTYTDLENSGNSLQAQEFNELDLHNSEVEHEEGKTNYKKINTENVNSQYRGLFAYYKDLNSEGLLSRRDEVVLSAQKKICKEKVDLISQRISANTKSRYLSEKAITRLAAVQKIYEKRAFKIREKFINSNLRFVIDLANRYQSRGLPLSDLIQEGNIGLIKAVEKFDHMKGFKFSTYSAWWIHQALSRAIMEKTKVISIPVYLQEKSSIVYKAKTKIEHNRDRKADINELAEQSGLSKDMVNAILHSRDLTVPLELSGEDSDTKTYLDIVPDAKSIKADNYIAERTMVKRVKRSLNILNDRERDILKMRYGIGYRDEHKLDQIGLKYGLSRERIRQIETIALKKIANSNDGEMLREFLT